MGSFDRDDYADFFESLTEHRPFPFQLEAAELMLAGRNLVITAPTGSGKTWAVVAPHLYALDRGAPMADRLLYALPLRSLADSLYASVQAQVREHPVGGFDPEKALRMQSGSVKEDPFFEGRLTFTTLDQLLSGYLTVPVSLMNRLGNINAGALPGAAVVFDEMHLLEPAQALGTAIEMGRRLKSLMQLTLMTATLPQECVSLLCDQLGAAHVRFADADLEQAVHLRDRQRFWTWVDQPLTAADVLREHHAGRTLAICNTVARAQALYRELTALLGADAATRCVLLHSRFLPLDRAEHERAAAPSFESRADENDRDIIVVTTQVVEAGMDWGADTLHSELAPANALVQRAGRCARFKAPRNVGRVLVYELQQNERGERAVGPYRQTNRSPDPAIEATYEAARGFRDTLLTANGERAFVERVHRDADLAVLRQVAGDIGTRARDIERALFDAGERARLSDLVRDADSVNVVVSSSPEQLQLENGPESVSIPRQSLGGLRGAFPAAEDQWLAKRPEISEDGVVSWRAIEQHRDLMSAPWFLALSPAIADYSPEYGLVFGEPGAAMPVRHAKRPPRLGSQYTIERWSEHATRVAEQAENARGRWQRAADKLDAYHALPAGTSADLLQLTCLLHDFGKLSKRWQDAMQGWQRVKNPAALAALHGAPIAHTDFDPKTDSERQRQEHRQPPHAMEGAYASENAIWEKISVIPVDETIQAGLGRSVASAIARHHGPRTKSIRSFTWVAAYAPEVDVVLQQPGACGSPRTYGEEDTEAKNFSESGVLRATDAYDREWLPLYWFLVRNLRLADQSSQAARQEK